MPALDLVLPFLIGFIILFYVIIMWYVWYLWRGERRVTDGVKSFEKKLDDYVRGQFQVSFEQLLKSFEQRASDSSAQLSVLLQDYHTQLLGIVQQTQMQQQDGFGKYTQELQGLLTTFRQDLGVIKKSVETDVHAALQEKVGELYDAHTLELKTLQEKYEHELEGYKQLTMHQTDEQVKSYGMKVLRELFSESLRDDDHERLFSAAVERAKREGLFRGDVR